MHIYSPALSVFSSLYFNRISPRSFIIVWHTTALDQWLEFLTANIAMRLVHFHKCEEKLRVHMEVRSNHRETVRGSQITLQKIPILTCWVQYHHPHHPFFFLGKPHYFYSWVKPMTSYYTLTWSVHLDVLHLDVFRRGALNVKVFCTWTLMFQIHRTEQGSWHYLNMLNDHQLCFYVTAQSRLEE